MYLPTKYLIFGILITLNGQLFAQEKPLPWLDQFHVDVSNSLFNSADWFDNFFADEHIADLETQASAKIRIGWEPKEHDLAKLKTRVRLRLRLPNFKRKVDLIFDDYEEVKQEGVTEELINESRNKQQSSDFNVALRWIHKSDKKHYFSTRIGLASHPDIYARALYRYIWQTSKNTNIVLQPSIYYYADQGHAERLSVNFEASTTDTDLFQFNNSWRYIQERDKVDWSHSVAYLTQLTQTQALISSIFVNGITNNGYHLENKGISIRYRIQSSRTWLFFEVEPFIHWPESEDFEQTAGIALRVEGRFYQ
ncbi:hypothetical protein [Algibacillus agarilyticus]|uniref:hypothetical protein n=1 Tax=Algibacillus agarilyticus TaxID=2234133 RepID=UPI000DCF6E2C|nr:hypothetical protein [Algibacillus agarilyticus]